MFLENNYLNPDEPEGVSASANGCVWAGCLYERKSGGFDLFYDHASSDFRPLNVEAITKLRHLAFVCLFYVRLSELLVCEFDEPHRNFLLKKVAPRRSFSPASSFLALAGIGGGHGGMS
jgi:hypothetical protein